MKKILLLLLLLMPLNVAFAQTGTVSIVQRAAKRIKADRGRIVTLGGHSNETTLLPGEINAVGCLEVNSITGKLESVSPCNSPGAWADAVYWVNDRARYSVIRPYVDSLGEVLPGYIGVGVPAQSSGGSAIKCTVTKVYDGDNVGCVAKIGRGKEQYHNFRIVGIDAPEVKGKQPFYTQSRDALRDAVMGREVTLELRGYDSIWKRNTVRVLVGDEDIGLKQILNGHAWFYPQYARTLSPDQKQSYEDAMTAAKLNKRGIWSRKKPIKPSLWRRGQR